MLHINFVEVLPVEITIEILSYLDPRSLLEASTVSKSWRTLALNPTVWRLQYISAGWDYHEKEVRAFEEEVRQREEASRVAHIEALQAKARKEYNTYDNYIGQLEKDKELAGGSTTTGRDMQIDTEGVSKSAMETTQAPITRQAGLPNNNSGYSIPSSDEEELYPSPHLARRISIPEARKYQIQIVPRLTTKGYGNITKLNWVFLFKQRKRLEENWLHNKFTTFQVPNPAYPSEGHRECIYTIQYSRNFLVSGSRDKTIRKWDIRTRRLVAEPMKGHTGSVLCLQFDESPEEDIIISGSSDSNVIIWKFSTGRILKTIPRAHQEPILNLRFNKKYLVTCSKDKMIKVWNRSELQPYMKDYPYASKHLFGQNRIMPHQQEAMAIHQTMDPIYQPISPYTAIQLLHGHVAAVNAIQLHGDEIASASGDRVIKIWNVKTGNCEKSMLGHTKGIACIQFDGKTVVSGSSDSSIRIFDRHSGADIYKLVGHDALVRTVQATSDRIVSGSYDETVRVWVRRRVLKGYEGEDQNEFIQAAILKEGLESAPATGYGRGIGALAANPMFQIQQAIADHARLQTNVQHPIQQAQMHMHHGQPHQQVQPPPQFHQMHPPMWTGIAGAGGPPPPPQQQQQQQQQFQAGANPLNMPGFQVPPQMPGPHPHMAQQQVAAAGPAAAPVVPQHQGPAPVVPQQQQQAHGHHHHHHHAGGDNMCKVFKLQFDARWIICCCQDSKIMGWDFADADAEIIAGSRFFKES